MGFLDQLLNLPPCPGDQKTEVDKLVAELLRIGRMDDFLATSPGGQFNMQCRHIRAREIGKQLDHIAGYSLMQWVHERTRRKLGKTYAEHLEYAWDGVGSWTH